jgi:hypothetical protein
MGQLLLYVWSKILEERTFLQRDTQRMVPGRPEIKIKIYSDEKND